MAIKKTRKPMIRQPKTDRAKETQKVVLEAAAQILLDGGIEGFNTNRIAETAGVSVGTLYQYYRNKDEVIVALMDQCIQRRVQRIRAALELKALTASTRQTVTRIVDSLFAYESQLDSALELHLFPYVALGRPDLSKKYVSSVDQILSPMLRTLLAIRFPKLVGRNLELVGFMLSQTVRGNVIGVNLFPEYKEQIPGLKKELVRMIVSYLEGSVAAGA